jgi:hypothetical protein
MDSIVTVRMWIQSGCNYYEALMWGKEFFPLDVAFPWKKAGYDGEDTRSWRSVVGDNVDKANKWKRAGFTSEETRLWIRETDYNINRAIQFKKRGHPDHAGHEVRRRQPCGRLLDQ